MGAGKLAAGNLDLRPGAAAAAQGVDGTLFGGHLYEAGEMVQRYAHCRRAVGAEQARHHLAREFLLHQIQDGDSVRIFQQDPARAVSILFERESPRQNLVDLERILYYKLPYLVPYGRYGTGAGGTYLPYESNALVLTVLNLMVKIVKYLSQNSSSWLPAAIAALLGPGKWYRIFVLNSW